MNFEGVIKQYISQVVAQKIAQKLGLSQQAVQSALDQAITALVGAMRGNAGNAPQMTQPLYEAITADHDGSIFEHIEELVAHPQESKGAKIIEHIMGTRTDQIESELAQKEGIDKGSVKNIFEIVAPLAMGALGKEQKEKNITLEQFEKALH